MIRPVDAEISQRFGDNPTKYLAPGNPLILAFGNYQPDGHTGEDYACPVGSPVRAVTAGTVLHIGWMGGGYADNPWWVMPSFAGYCAVIDHGSFVGIYGHCSDGSAKVSKGDRVTEGQVFILSGNTGGSTGPHLHFEILPDGWVLNSKFYGRTDPEALFSGSIQVQGATIITEEDDMFTEEDRALLRATLNKADGGQLRADLGYQNDTLFSKADGAWQNGLLADISARLGRTLDKSDGGYIVGLLNALKPGETDAAAIADAVVSAVGKDVAAEVVKSLGEKLGAA